MTTTFMGLTDGQFDLAGLKAASDKLKPKSLADVADLVELYEDSGHGVTNAYLERIGLGLEDNRRPLQADLLRYIIHRISPVYARSPVRYLANPKTDRRFTESSAEHKRMVEVVQRAQLDLAMRDASRLRSLVSQVAMRFYPVDAKKAVVVRTFVPSAIHRMPDAAVGDVLDEDRAFALELSGGVFECWWKEGDRWRMVWTDKGGALVEDQPFEAPGYFNPYPALPVLFTYDTFPGGRPWLPIRVSRVSWALSVNGIGNDLLAMVARQTHSQRVFKTEDPNRPPPKDAGPGETAKIHSRDTLETLDYNPRLKEAAEVLDRLTAMWLYSEDLDPSELMGGTPATGAALRVRSRGLQERREGQVPLAYEDERLTWEKLRAVHNVHAEGWGVATLSEETAMRIEPADLDIPEDQSDVLDNGAKALALGVDSTIDLIQQRRNLNRQQAIARYHRVAEDLKAYPPPKKETTETAGDLANAGPGFTESLNPMRETQGQEPTDSTVDAIRDRSAADARADRRAEEGTNG